MSRQTIHILKSLLFIIFGILIISSPSNAVVLLTTYFGILAIIAGALSLFSSYRLYSKSNRFGIGLPEGVLSLVIGIMIIIYPQKSAEIFMIIIGIWALIMSIIQFFAYRAFNEFNFRSGSILISAILSLLVALLLLFRPFEFAGFIALIVGIYAIVFGVTMLLNPRK